MQLFRSRAEQHRILIESRYGEGLREADFDPSLRQVFANLVGNALEAMEASGGRILVRARLHGGSRQFACVTVADSGQGIARENLRSIFEPFFTTKGERGTGLGLWVTRGIVEEQGGSLRLRTATRGQFRGTTIRITLPVPQRSPPESLSAAQA